MTRSEAAAEITRLAGLIRTYEHEYHVLGRPSVSDIEFDGLFDRLVELESEFPDLVRPDSPSARVGSDLTTELPEVRHTIPVLSLDKAYSIEEVGRWIEKTVASADEELSFVAEEKIDGISIVLYYEAGLLVRAVTRGNGVVGNDVTANVRTIASVPLRLPRGIDLAVRGEIYLRTTDFEELNRTLDEPYANPRNFAAGAIRRIRSAETAEIPLTIFVYEAFTDGLATHLEALSLLEELGFRRNPRTGFFAAPGSGNPDLPGLEVGTFDDVGGYIRRVTAERRDLDYEINGLVFKVNEVEVREDLGNTGHHPRWAVAFKFESPEGATTVSAIDVQVGRTGRITPVARVAPVSIGGTTISNVTLHNQEYIGMLELAVGDTVAVSRRGDVIPAVERVVEKNTEGNSTWELPVACPSCGSELELRGAHHFCPNPGCPAQVRGRLYFFVGRDQMDIDSVGPETIDTLVDNGFVSDLPDLYRFDPAELADLPGFGEKKIELIRTGIDRSRERPFRAVLPAIGIPELGPKVTELLIDSGIRSVGRLFEIVDAKQIETLIAINGIGEKTAERIVSELSEPQNRKRIEALRAAGLSFESDEPGPGETEEQIFASQTWCVTGSFERFKPRKLALDEVKARGGDTTSQVSGKTTHLLAGAGGGSKLDRAKELGIEIVDEATFLELIGWKS